MPQGFQIYFVSNPRNFRHGSSGLPKVTFWAVAEAVNGKTSATVAEAEGLDFTKSLVGHQFA